MEEQFGRGERERKEEKGTFVGDGRLGCSTPSTPSVKKKVIRGVRWRKARARGWEERES